MGEARRGRLVLPASPTATARVEVEPQPRSRRLNRTLLILVTSWVLMPVVFFIPPHLLWPALVFVVGIYLARRTWVGEYVVRSFEGDCPRCGEPLSVEAGTRARSRQRLECYSCHREPELVIAEAEATDSNG